MKYLSAISILVLILSLHTKTRCEDDFVVIEEVELEEVDDAAYDMNTESTDETPTETTAVPQTTTPGEDSSTTSVPPTPMSSIRTTSEVEITVADNVTESVTTEIPEETDPTTRLPTTTPAPIDAPQPVPPNFGETPVEATLTFPGNFEEDLENPSTPLYRQYERATIDRMNTIFQSNSRYQETRVNGFRNGSIIADINVIMDDILSKDGDGSFSFCSEVNNITAGDVTFFNGQDCSTYLQNQVRDYCGNSSPSICVDTWQCVYDGSDATCQHPCYIAKASDPAFCSGSAQICTVRVNGNVASAECTCESPYLNAGGNCIHQNIIIIIASVCGGILLIVFITLVAVMAVRLNRKPYDYIDPYVPSKGGKRAADLWASVPDDSSQNLRPYAEEFDKSGQNTDNWTNRNSPRDSDSGRVTSGHDNQAFEADEKVRGWNNIPLNDDDSPKNFQKDATEDLDKVSEVSALDMDDTYMRSLLSSTAYKEIGDSEFAIKRPVFRMDNLKNKQKDEEKSEGEEFVF